MTHVDFVGTMDDLHIFASPERTMPFRTEELRALSAIPPDGSARDRSKHLRTLFRELFPKSIDEP